jgi:hypothetical protein
VDQVAKDLAVFGVSGVKPSVSTTGQLIYFTLITLIFSVSEMLS